MKTKRCIGIALLLALLVVGCNLGTGLTFDDIKGEWDFADRVIKSENATGVHLSVMDGPMFDLGWNTADNSYWFACNGTMDGNVFTGTYSGWDGNLPSGETEIDTNEPITVTFSLSAEGNLTAVFSGTGTLDGVTLTEGTLTP